MRCPGGWCDWCPVKIQIKCMDERMTPTARIEHIRQCLRNMKPTMGYEVAYATVIGQELDELERIFARLDEYVRTAETGGFVVCG